MRPKTIVLAADHAGFGAKEYIKEFLQKSNYKVEDIGAFSKKPVDYPKYAEKVALSVSGERNKKGILVCGTGIGASIAANKIPGIRAALVNSAKDARLSEDHNNANILVLGGRPYNKNRVKIILKAWLGSKFQGGRHLRRLREIRDIEKKYMR